MLSLVVAAAAAPLRGQVDSFDHHFFPLNEPKNPTLTPPDEPFDHFRYGHDHWQGLDLLKASTRAPAPLVVIVGFGPWRSRTTPYELGWVPYRLHEHGYAVAYVSYFRETDLSPDHAAANIAAAIAFLRSRSAKLRLDPDRFALLGFDAGAHFATLLGTDEHYLTEAGIPFSALRAVGCVNGEGYDIPRRIAEGGFRRSRFEEVFGKLPDEQRRRSPVAHLTPPNAPAFLFMNVESEAQAAGENRAMTRTLSAAGINASFVLLPRYWENTLATHFLGTETGAGAPLVSFLTNELKSSPATGN